MDAHGKDLPSFPKDDFFLLTQSLSLFPCWFTWVVRGPGVSFLQPFDNFVKEHLWKANPAAGTVQGTGNIEQTLGLVPLEAGGTWNASFFQSCFAN